MINLLYGLEIENYQNGETIQIGDITGEYYIKAQACDMLGNCAEKDAGIYYLDGELPTIEYTINGTTATIELKDNIGLLEYAINDSLEIPESYESLEGISTTKTYEATKPGVYYIFLKDTSNNMAYGKMEFPQSAFCPYDIGQTWNFSYLGNVEEFVIPCTGTYQLEVWGAQGGSTSKSKGYNRGAGGKGGYSSGVISLISNNSLYLAISDVGWR